jgi:hypothetical protein
MKINYDMEEMFMAENPAQQTESILCNKDRLCHASIEIQASNIHRYGVFANETILPGEIIEECPVILFNTFWPEIRNYAFNWDNIKSAIPLGCGCVYNHSDKPNTEYRKNLENKTMVFVATKPIYRGEEILINYGTDWFKERIINAPASYVKRRKHTIKHIIFLSLFLLIAYSFTNIMPIAAKHPAQSAQPVTNAPPASSLKH